MNLARWFFLIVLFPIFSLAVPNFKDVIDCSVLPIGRDQQLGLSKDGKLYVKDSENKVKYLEKTTSSTPQSELYVTIGPSFFCRNVYKLEKINNRPASLDVESGKCFGFDSDQEDHYDFSYNQDQCYVSKITSNKTKKILYDVELCSSLSDLLSRISESDINKCSDLLSSMSRAVNNYKEKIKGSEYNLKVLSPRDPFQEALLQSAECRRRLGYPKDSEANGFTSLQIKKPTSNSPTPANVTK